MQLKLGSNLARTINENVNDEIVIYILHLP